MTKFQIALYNYFTNVKLTLKKVSFQNISNTCIYTINYKGSPKIQQYFIMKKIYMSKTHKICMIKNWNINSTIKS